MSLHIWNDIRNSFLKDSVIERHNHLCESKVFSSLFSLLQSPRWCLYASGLIRNLLPQSSGMLLLFEEKLNFLSVLVRRNDSSLNVSHLFSLLFFLILSLFLVGFNCSIASIGMFFSFSCFSSVEEVGAALHKNHISMQHFIFEENDKHVVEFFLSYIGEFASVLFSTGLTQVCHHDELSSFNSLESMQLCKSWIMLIRATLERTSWRSLILDCMRCIFSKVTNTMECKYGDI